MKMGKEFPRLEWVLVCGILLCVFAVYFALNYLAPLYDDDFMRPGMGFFDSWQQAFKGYFDYGGRIAGYAWMNYCRSLPPAVLSAVIATVITATMLCMHILAVGSYWLRKGILPSVALAVSLYWFSLPDAMEVTIWKIGAVYSIGIFCTCLCLIPYRFLLDGKNCLTGRVALFFYCLLAVYTSFLLEIFPFTIAFSGLLSTFFLKKQSRPIPKWAWLTPALCAVCGVISYLSPANFMRAEQITIPLLYTLFSFSYKFIYSICIPAVIFAIIYCMLKKFQRVSLSEKEHFYILLLFIGSIIAGLPQILGKNISYRALSLSVVLVIIACNVLFIIFYKKNSYSALIPIVTFILFIFSAYSTTVEYAALHAAQLQRENMARLAAARGETEIFLPELPPIHAGNYFFGDTLRGNPIPAFHPFISKYLGLQNAWLLMSGAPEQLLSPANIIQQANINTALTPRLIVKSFAVSRGSQGLVLSLRCRGDISTIDRIIFLTASESSSLLIRGIANLAGMETRFPGPALYNKIVELMGRTTVLIRKNTLLVLPNGDALIYTLINPKTYTDGKLLAAVVRVSLRDGSIRYLHCALPPAH